MCDRLAFKSDKVERVDKLFFEQNFIRTRRQNDKTRIKLLRSIFLGALLRNVNEERWKESVKDANDATIVTQLVFNSQLLRIANEDAVAR